MKELSECRILVVDDVPANIDILVQALRGEYQLSVALDGKRALSMIEKVTPDLVLLDIMMPELDGYEVCRRLRASERTRDLPVMFLSALEDVHDKTKGFEAGGNDYLVKPFDVLEVKARVRSLLKAKAYADAVKEKIAYDLRVAREIQMGILPADISELANGSGLEADAILEPAQAVGGDLYDALRTVDGNLALVIGDVSGKGIPAALFMAVTVTLARALVGTPSSPAAILRGVSDALVQHNPRNMFVTLICARFDRARSELTYASAGHPAPVLIRAGQATLLPLEPDMAAGIRAGLAPPSHAVQLQQDDLVVFYTDGVTEAFDSAGNLFGETRLLETLAPFSGRSASETTAGLLRGVRDHAGDYPQSDDIAILAVRRTA